MALLFARDKSVISRHLKNVFASMELSRKAVVAENATTAADGKIYQVEYDNLDAIISVGYRVNSQRGTQLRIWATRVLKEFLVRGFSVNERRMNELRLSLRRVKNVVDRIEITSDGSRALLSVLSDYAYALDLLDDFDHRRIAVSEVQEKPAVAISYDDALTVVERLKEIFGG